MPKRDPKTPLFGRGYLTELAGRHDLALKIQGDPGFHLSNDDMRAIAFSLRFTAERLGGDGEQAPKQDGCTVIRSTMLGHPVACANGWG